MRLCAAGWVGLLLTVTLGSAPPPPPAPAVWSADGRWLAYTVAVRADERLFSPGWLYRLESPEGAAQLGWSEPPVRLPVASYRLWASRAEVESSVLLQESPLPLTSPVWRSDGRALGFGRVVSEAEGRLRFEIVIQDAPDRQRIVFTQGPLEPGLRLDDLPGLAPAWSADGRYLAVPWVRAAGGLVIIRVDDGRVLKELPEARLPSWSADGTKLAFVQGGGEAQTLAFLDTNFGTPRTLAVVGQAWQAPVWSRDKRWIQVVVRRKGRRPKEAEPVVTALVRAPLGGEGLDDAQLPTDPRSTDQPELGVSFSFDRDDESLLFSSDADGDQSIVSWFLPRTRAVYKKDNPIDFTIRVRSFAVAPGGKSLGFRAGGPGFFAPTGLWDLASGRFTPVIPDDSARLEWIGLLAASARRVLHASLPVALDVKGRVIERATTLPIPGEIAANDVTLVRLRKLGRLGAAFSEGRFQGDRVKPAIMEQVEEARLFFDYLRGEYEPVLRGLERLESRGSSPDERLRLVSLRAQVLFGQGNVDGAERTIAFLQELERNTPRRLETTPAGPTVVSEESPGRGWAEYLAQKVKEGARAAGPSKGTNFDRRTPEGIEPLDVDEAPLLRDPFFEQRMDDPPPDQNGAAGVIEEGGGKARRLVPVAPQPDPPPVAPVLRRTPRPPF